MQMYGSTLHHFLITYHLQPSLKETFSAFMVVSHHQLTLSIKSTNLIESWKCQPKVQFVIFFGQTQMIDVVGVYHQEVLDTHLVKILVSNSTIQMISS